MLLISSSPCYWPVSITDMLVNPSHPCIDWCVRDWIHARLSLFLIISPTLNHCLFTYSSAQMYIFCLQCFVFGFTTQLIELLFSDLVAGYINLNFCAIIQKVLQKKNVCNISRNISNPVQSSSAWTHRMSSSHCYDVLSVLTIHTCMVWPQPIDEKTA